METKRTELINLLKETIESIEKCTDEGSKKVLFEKSIEAIKANNYIGMDAPIFEGDLHFLVEHTKRGYYDEAFINIQQVIMHLLHSKYLNVI